MKEWKLLIIKISYWFPIRWIFWKKEKTILLCNGLHEVNYVSRFYIGDLKTIRIN